MKISIITVTYNRAETLVNTMDSVLALDYNDLEYIVVDGASKDSTIQILKDYELRFKKISETVGRTFTFRWISESDKGLYDAMNKGIRMATGDVVGIINSDHISSQTETKKLSSFPPQAQIPTSHPYISLL